MSIEDIGYAEKKRQYDRQYHRDYKKNGGTHFRLKSSDNMKLREYYNEYTTTCQQNQYPTVGFHEFIVQFAEVGFFSWRDRTKGK